MGVLRGIGALVVVGALAGSGYVAVELRDAQDLQQQVDELKTQVADLRERQVALAGTAAGTADLTSLASLVHRLDEDLGAVRGQLAERPDPDLLASRLAELDEQLEALERCLRRGLVVDERDEASVATCRG